MNNATTRASLPQASKDLSPARKGLPEARKSSDPAPDSARHPDLLSWKEAAALLGCSRTTLKRIKAAGEIGYTPVGSGSRPRIWFTRADIDEYLEAKRHAPRQQQRSGT